MPTKTNPSSFPLWKFVCYLIHPWEEDQVTATWSNAAEWAMHYGWNYDTPHKTGQRLLNENHTRIMDLMTKRNLAIERAVNEEGK